jgi:hypothetical protein
VELRAVLRPRRAGATGGKPSDGDAALLVEAAD